MRCKLCSRIGAALLCVAALAGCDQGRPRGSITGPEVRPTLDGEGVIESVTGYVALTQSPTAERDLSFAAIRHGDGTVSGEFQHGIRVNTPGFRRMVVLHGRVTCFTISENRAVIAGVVERGQVHVFGFPPVESGLVGEAVFWEVADNGESADDPADESSLLAPAGATPGDHAACARGPLGTTSPIERGNIQIHPTPQP